MRLRYERDADGNLRELVASDPTDDLLVEELPEAVVPELLATQPVARIALELAERVHIVPVNHLVGDQGEIVFRTAPGRKLDLAQRGEAQAVLEADHALDRLPGWFVTVAGRLEPVLELTEIAHYERAGLRTYADADPERRDHWLRLVPERPRAYRVSTAAMGSPRPGRNRELSAPAPIPGRGALEEMTEAECLACLDETDIGRLAILIDGEPRLVPVAYQHLDGSLYVHRVMGERIDAVTGADQTVVVEVDVLDPDTWTGRSVVVEGSLERLHVREGHVLPPDPQGAPWSVPAPREELLRVRIGSVTGRRIVRDG